MRGAFAALSGGLFGLGLTVSGMTDTRKVQGWLDVLGDWDPTLAFVLGGAILPMVCAWLLTKHRSPLAGGRFPARPDPKIDRDLTLGAVLFGIGWGLVGLCPGPALAALAWGGWEVALFVLAMAGGMIATPPLRRTLDAGFRNA